MTETQVSPESTTEGDASQAAVETTQTSEVSADEQAQEQQTASTLTDGGTTEESAEETASTEDAEGESADSEEAEAGAPEEYSFEAPEGHEFDSEVIATFGEAARELDLTQEQAQGFLDKIAPKMQERAAQLHKSRVDEWKEARATDEEVGGDKLPANLKVAEKALAAFGDDELRGLLNDSGLWAHRAVARLLVKVGNAIATDQVEGETTAQGADDAEPTRDEQARRMFPKSLG